MSKKFYLAGLVHCGKCGASMTPKTTTTKGKDYYYYSCSTFNTKGKDVCDQRSVSAIELEDDAVEEIADLFQRFKGIKKPEEFQKLNYEERNRLLKKIEELKQATYRLVVFEREMTREQFYFVNSKIKDELIDCNMRLDNIQKKINYCKQFSNEKEMVNSLLVNKENFKNHFDLYFKDIIVTDWEVDFQFY